MNSRVQVYEGNLFGVPNIEIIKECLGSDYLPEVELTPLLDEDDYFQMLSYTYLVPKEHYTSHERLKYFKDIAKAIDDRHAKGIVHSDVRSPNMVFLQDGKGKLIDLIWQV